MLAAPYTFRMSAVETEVKFRVEDMRTLEERLLGLGFRAITPPTFERNTLYDTPERRLRERHSILRIRKYGDRWLLTHKRMPDDHDPAARHKRRVETETEVTDGDALGVVFCQLGYEPVFIYEKWRAEYADETGHCVLDETPIGAYAELEGPANWIDAVSARLGLDASSLITLSYGRLFEEWRKATGSTARDMTFPVVSEQV
jgi:adenylate cyclase class 2